MFPPGCNRQCQLCQQSDQCKTPFRQMFVNALDGISLITDNKFILANNAAVKIMGLTNIQQLLGRHPADFAPQFQRCGASSKLKADSMMTLAKQTGSSRFEWLAQYQDGSPLPMYVTLKSVLVAKQQAILVFTQSINSAQKPEQGLSFLVELTEQLFSLMRLLVQQSWNQPLSHWPELISPILVSIVKQANSQGVMQVPAPHQTIKLLLQLGLDTYDRLHNVDPNQQDAELNRTLSITTYLQCVERTLNLDPGTLTLSPRLYELARDIFSLPQDAKLPN